MLGLQQKLHGEILLWTRTARSARCCEQPEEAADRPITEAKASANSEGRPHVETFAMSAARANAVSRARVVDSTAIVWFRIARVPLPSKALTREPSLSTRSSSISVSPHVALRSAAPAVGRRGPSDVPVKSLEKE